MKTNLEINFDKLQDEILDIQDERSNENRIIANQISRWLNSRKGKCFCFSDVNELRRRRASVVVSYFNHDEMTWMERAELKVDYIQYYPEENDFEAVGYIEGKNEDEACAMKGRNLDLESLERIVDWLAQYQREQNGTAKTPEQLAKQFNAEDFGKEYNEKEAYRNYIDNQLDAAERIMLALYFDAPEKARHSMPMTPRTIFALHIKEL